MVKYLKKLPKPLLKDLLAGRWLPFVGAGFSKNAKLPIGKTVPLWDELGKLFAEELDDYTPNNALDAISAFEHEYSRPKLIERLKDLLFVDEARPGEAHAAFCTIPFDIVCTTNFDFLLEKQYDLIGRHCTPIVDQDQLSINLADAGTSLLKIHGDLHHPHRLVATESDYDSFLERYPLLATFLSSLLITRVAVFIGYSLDDPDFRQVWQVVRDRLGKSAPLAYAIIVSPKQTDISRFERRGVKVIGLDGKKEEYETILSSLFTEITNYWTENVIANSQVKRERPLQELSLPLSGEGRLALFSIPASIQPFYREYIFPIAESAGFVPVTADDIISPGDNWLAKVDALLRRARLFISDVSSTNVIFETESALRTFSQENILLISPDKLPSSLNIRGATWILRSNLYQEDNAAFINRISDWFGEVSQKFKQNLSDEPRRLLALREHRAAVISAMSLLESTLRQKLEPFRSSSDNLYRKNTLMSNILSIAFNQDLINENQFDSIRTWNRIRNEAVHNNVYVNPKIAQNLVHGVYALIEDILRSE